MRRQLGDISQAGCIKTRDPRRALVVALACLPALLFAQSASSPTSAPLAKLPYHESPKLALEVSKGKLPPVEKRLPEHPAVVTPVERIGKYGGTWRRLAAAPGDMCLASRMGYEPLLRWDRDAKKVVPGIAESWEVKDDAKTFVFHLRPGMRWSDGVPFTSDAFLFFYEDILLNDDIAPSKPKWLKINGQLCKVEAPDPYTVIYRFAGSYGIFPENLAFNGQQRELFAPRHYMKQFLPKYTPLDQLTKLAKKEGFTHWSDQVINNYDPEKNPDLPVVSPFKLQIAFPAPRCPAVRNPYYWKVDPEGNQLPYIDEIVFTTVFDNTVLNLKAMNGEVDFQIRRIDAGNFTLFKESSQRNSYRVMCTPSTNPICVYVNQWSLDPEIRPILQDRRFRQALSLAINRKELIDLIYTGLAEPSNGFITPMDPYYLPGMEKANTEYDPEKAGRLLDEMGMKKGPGGMRRLPNGKPFSQIMHVYPSEEGYSPEMWQLVADYWREVGLAFQVKHEDPTLSVIQVGAGQSDFWTYINAGFHWAIEGLWKAPLDFNSYFAPLCGRYQVSQGQSGVKPPPELQRLADWYNVLRSTPDEKLRLEMGHKILKQWQDECYVIGICNTYTIGIVANRFKNVPPQIYYDYRLKGPGYVGIEQFFIDDKAGRP